MKLKESEHIEFKKSLAELKEGLISISAILNKHQKGILYFGLKPDGSPVKATYSQKTLRDISQSISSKIEPRIYPSIEIIRINSIDVIKITFDGHQIPYSAEGRYYIRVADEDKQMTAEELKKFIINNKDHRWDSSTNSKAFIKDISVQKLKSFCKLASIKFSNTKDVLESLNLIPNSKLLNAAVILFAKQPQKFCKNALLSCAVFATDKTSNILDQKTFEGDLFYLLSEAEKYILKNIHIGMNVKGLYRSDIPEINQEAIREALINSFLHRDYFDPDFVSIHIFKNRVEIKNPGEIFGGLTISDITSRHISKRRNEIIADIFNRAHLGERKGRGISLILEKEPKTKFEQIAGLFITTLNRKPDLYPQIDEGLNEGLKSLLNFIEKNPGLNAITLSKHLNVSLATIERRLKELKEDKYILFKGSKKTGGYFIK